MDKLCKTGVITPPEEPELSATRGLVPPPNTQHICRQASAETAQDRVLLSHREKDWRGGGSLPHKTPPFYSSQISLKEKNSDVRMNTEKLKSIKLFSSCLLHNSSCILTEHTAVTSQPLLSLLKLLSIELILFYLYSAKSQQQLP